MGIWEWTGGFLKASISFTGKRLFFHFEKDHFDLETIEKLRFSMTEEEIYIDLEGVDIEGIHPDIIALCTILLCNPFVGKELHLPGPVSRGFFNSVNTVVSRYEIVSEVDDELEQNIPLEMGIPALAFSGGADSCAALAIMPGSTIPVFLNRPEIVGTKYDAHAPLKICEILKESGYEVKVIETNLEFVRKPTGFPTDLANGIPALLLSNHLGIDSIAFGTVLESAYGIGHEKFIDYKNGAHWRFFSTLFSAAGVDLSMPTIGISEVGTAIIGNKSAVAGIAQSCIRGTYRNPCLKCWKCFRKQLLAKAIGIVNDVDFVSMMGSNEVQIRLSSYPISHENVVSYSLQRIDSEEYPFFKPLIKKLDMGLDLGLLDHWYSESIFHVPPKYRASTREKILKFIDPMNISHEYFLKNWDMEPHLEMQQTRGAQNDLTTFWQNLTD